MSFSSYYTERQLKKDLEIIGREVESLRESLAYADRTMAELDRTLCEANAALREAWALMDWEQKVEFLDDKYAEELFWDEPERIERDSR